MIGRVGLVVKDAKEPKALAGRIAGYLKRKKIKARRYRRGENADLIIALGGDGIILKAASIASGKDIPLLGINFGTAGFLTEIEPEAWKSSLDKVLSGKYRIDRRIKLDVIVNGKKIGEALNEAVVTTAMPVKMLSLNLYVNRKRVETLKADGVIISTPTGSTAYSLSCGGPVVEPSLSCIIITAICPFEYSLRPIIVPGDSEITVKLAEPKEKGMVVIDGEHKKKLSYENKVSFKISKNCAYFFRLRANFYEKLRKRL